LPGHGGLPPGLLELLTLYSIITFNFSENGLIAYIDIELKLTG